MPTNGERLLSRRVRACVRRGHCTTVQFVRNVEKLKGQLQDCVVRAQRRRETPKKYYGTRSFSTTAVSCTLHFTEPHTPKTRDTRAHTCTHERQNLRNTPKPAFSPARLQTNIRKISAHHQPAASCSIRTCTLFERRPRNYVSYLRGMTTRGAIISSSTFGSPIRAPCWFVLRLSACSSSGSSRRK